jgi:uncharacterized protein YabN with tetrapyrrole methylase and pyrophosphatase domain
MLKNHLKLASYALSMPPIYDGWFLTKTNFSYRGDKMKESFAELIELTKKSLKHDPWCNDNGLKGYCESIIKETEELKEAVNKKDHKNLKEELGDVLLCWCHACMLAEQEKLFTTKEVIDSIRNKLTRRKPYILTNTTVAKEEPVEIWKQVKEQEKHKK